MAKTGEKGLRRILNAFVYSAQGFGAAWRHEAAFRQELLLVAVLLPVAIWLGRNAIDYALLIGSLVVVLIVELLNSAIEAAIDRHGDEHHELSGRAKDMGSAAVFMGLVLIAVVWGLIIYDRLVA